MTRAILYSVLYLLIYFGIFKGVIWGVSSLIIKYEILTNIDEYLIGLIDTIIYLSSIALIYIMHKYKKIRLDDSRSSVYLIPLLLILGLSIFYRIIEDPIFRADFIFGHVKSLSPIEMSNNNIVEKCIIFLNVVVLTPILEEALFRGIIMNFFKNTKIVFGVLFTSLLFTILHLKGFSADYIVISTSFLFSILACIIYLKFGLIHSIFFHFSYNFIWFILYLNSAKYWKILSIINFDFRYWLIIIFSIFITGVICYILFAKKLQTFRLRK